MAWEGLSVGTVRKASKPLGRRSHSEDYVVGREAVCRNRFVGTAVGMDRRKYSNRHSNVVGTYVRLLRFVLPEGLQE